MQVTVNGMKLYRNFTQEKGKSDTDPLLVLVIPAVMGNSTGWSIQSCWQGSAKLPRLTRPDSCHALPDKDVLCM
jgi:hypothetical protein